MKKEKLIILVITFVFYFFSLQNNLQAQQVPSLEESIDFLCTFSKEAPGKWGDDDHIQIHFFAIPDQQTQPFYIKVYDPEVGGKNDQINGVFNSFTKFTILGGKGAYSNKQARLVNPVGNFRSGIQLASKTFSKEPDYDNKWYSFGPFNPKEGEYDSTLKSTIFKIIIEGGAGDDGNMYRLFFSSNKDQNIPIEGGNCFAYEICFRLGNAKNQTAHVYPFVDSKVVSITQHNFDFDGDGFIRLTSVSKKANELKTSKDGDWQMSKKMISPDEHNTSIDIQFVKGTNKPNDMTFYLTNQYNEAIAFFSSPIGGVPKYKYKVDVIYQFDK
jgi:hypothetical protein